MITPERLLHRLDLRVIRRLDGLFQGDYRTMLLGNGIDFADLREYQPHDDVRHIDWNVTARMDTPYVREYLADRELTAWLLLDRSSSMRFGRESQGQVSKAEAVTDLVTTLARLLTRRGNRVGAALFDRGVHQVIEPRGGRNQVLRISHELLRPRSAEEVGSTERTDLGRAMASAAKSISRRSLVIVLSDFISAPGWERPLQLLARRHEVICIRIVAPAERTIEDRGVQVLEDMESGEQITVDTSDPALRERFEALVAERDDHLHQLVTRAGLDLHTVGTDEDLVTALVRLGERRRHLVR